MMAYLDLRDAGPCDGGHGRDEPVHFRIQRNLLDQGGPVGLEGAAVITNRHTRDLPDQAIGDLRGNFPGDQLVLAVVAPADHDVEALIHLVQEQLDITRIILQIPIHGDDDFACGVLDAGRHGGGLAIVAAELDQPDPGVLAGKLRANFRGIILATVIDEYHLEWDIEGRYGGHNGRVHPPDTVLFVIEGYDDRQFGTV